VIHGDLAGIESLRVVGQVNIEPAGPEDGQCLARWAPGAGPAGWEIRLVLEPWSGPSGEVFCRLFAAPEQSLVIDSPAVPERVAWSR
jgi:hypothetical protein